MTDLYGDPTLEIPIPAPALSPLDQLKHDFAQQPLGNRTRMVYHDENQDIYYDFTPVMYNNASRENQRLRAQVCELEDLLREALGNQDDDFINEIASIFGITLLKSYEFAFDVTFTGTFMAPTNVDPQMVLDSLTITCDTGYYTDADVEDFDVDFDITDSRWDEA